MMPQTLGFSATVDRASVAARAEATVRAQLTVRAPIGLVSPESAPVSTSICLVFDCSTSMQGPKLQAAIAAAKLIVELAGEQHRVSLVGFQSKSHLLVDNARADDAGLAAKIAQLELLTGGSTNLAAGIDMGMRALQKSPSDARVMVILSDGQANDVAKAERAAISATAAGIQIFAVGVGVDYEAGHLLSLVTPSNGALFGESEAHQLAGTFAGLMARFDRFVATEATVTLTLAEGVRLGSAYKTSPEQAFLSGAACDTQRRLVLKVGNVERDESYGFLLELTVPPSAGSLEIARATLRYDLPALGRRGEEHEVAVRVDCVESETQAATSLEVAQAFERAHIAQLGHALVEAHRKHDIKKMYEHLDALAADSRLRDRCEAARQELRVRGRIGKEALNGIVVASTAKSDRTQADATEPTVIVDPPADPTQPLAIAAGLYDVVLLEPGRAVIRLVRELRDATGLPLRKVSDLVEGAPSAVAVGVAHEAAATLERRLASAGARAELRPHAAL